MQTRKGIKLRERSNCSIKKVMGLPASVGNFVLNVLGKREIGRQGLLRLSYIIT